MKASSLVTTSSKVWDHVPQRSRKAFETIGLARGSDDGGQVSVALALSGSAGVLQGRVSEARALHLLGAAF